MANKRKHGEIFVVAGDRSDLKGHAPPDRSKDIPPADGNHHRPSCRADPREERIVAGAIKENVRSSFDHKAIRRPIVPVHRGLWLLGRAAEPAGRIRQRAPRLSWYDGVPRSLGRAAGGVTHPEEGEKREVPSPDLAESCN